MTYLVTGCAGFIGWHLTMELLHRGHRIVGVDNLNDYYDIRLKEWRLGELQTWDTFTFYQADISDYAELESLFAQNQFEGVFNLAARAGVRASVEDPWVYYRTNTEGTLNILECCRRYEVKHLVQASTSSIYGNNPTPFRVEDKTDHTISPYAASKKAAEELCYSYHYIYGIHVSIPRYFSVYGPAGRPDMAYFKFMIMIDRGDTIPVYGDGSQSRDFTFVKDVVEATIRGMDLEGYHIYNVGGEHPVELKEIIRLIEDGLGKKARIEYLPRHPADGLITFADINSTREKIGWAPTVDITEGLGKVLGWYQEHREWLQQLRLD
ncbi:MAG: NAD-dependent epimerase/dehydratase family protein [Calditrichaeota bacterium]|nr:MAG: NAD-dependent epimerase/dehydratase family protein [Calditrichota bacterium]